MPDTELITIGAFARSCGLNASALRFYADAGVLVPAVVDESTGYRYYTRDQTGTARLLGHLRAVDMPLPAVAAVLAEPDPARAATLLDTHLAALDQHLREVRAAATAARTALTQRHSSTLARADVAGRDSTDTSAGDLGRPAGPTRFGVERDGGVATAGRGQSTGGSSGGGRRDGGADPVSPPGPVADGGEMDEAAGSVVWVSGPMLAGAVDQVATATVTDSQWPVLDTILLEVSPDELTLTATDRIRLATRTLRPTHAPTTSWTATLVADDLRATLPWLRRRHSVALQPTSTHLEITTTSPDLAAATTPDATAARTGTIGPDGGEPHVVAAATGDRRAAEPSSHDPAPGPDSRRCRRSTEQFPDYRAMLAALPTPRTRIVLGRAELLRALEESPAPAVELRVQPTATVILAPAHRHGPLDSDPAPRTLSATITGPALTIHFAVTALHPAIASAVGPDVMLDLLAPDQPAIIRSADDGDLSTLVMPCRPDLTEETVR